MMPGESSRIEQLSCGTTWILRRHMGRMSCDPHRRRTPAHQLGVIKEAPSPASCFNGRSPLRVIRCRRARNSQALPRARGLCAPANRDFASRSS